MPRALPISAGGLCFIFLCLWFKPEAPRAMDGINDFIGIYTGAHLVGTPDQFNAAACLREQFAASGWTFDANTGSRNCRSVDAPVAHGAT
jgi:hypothetical protein